MPEKSIRNLAGYLEFLECKEQNIGSILLSMALTNEKNWVSEEDGERKTIEFASTTWILGCIESSK
jgi:hypothetical protein